MRRTPPTNRLIGRFHWSRCRLNRTGAFIHHSQGQHRELQSPVASSRRLSTWLGQVETLQRQTRLPEREEGLPICFSQAGRANEVGLHPTEAQHVVPGDQLAVPDDQGLVEPEVLAHGWRWAR